MSVIITLKFESRVLMQKEMDEKTKKPTGKMIEVVENGNTLYERDDILAVRQLLNIVEIANMRSDDERVYVTIREKINERWKAEDRDCEIEFNPKEIMFLEGYLKDVKSKARTMPGGISAATIQAPFHSVAKVSLLEQLNSGESRGYREGGANDRKGKIISYKKQEDSSK